MASVASFFCNKTTTTTTNTLSSSLLLPSSISRRTLATTSSRCHSKTRKISLVVRAARMESKGVSLGSRAPPFELEEPLTGNKWKLDDFEAYPALLVMFICNHCPFVKHLKKDIVKLSNIYKEKGLGVVAISSNSAVTHPQDGPDFMAEDARLLNYPFPYLYDHTYICYFMSAFYMYYTLEISTYNSFF
ncbi:thioredoxin superfamily protein [Artemisia annua]|uniref:Thioredoxin superfamily protein n=1 Tax=Artemisia annua TaxID=35608 RepID=A0A2U1NWP9_ARTAN|nr:thioredoxin superfamily protein [Artemisia annua]